MKVVYIAEKPSVANAFATALQEKTVKRDGFIESDKAIITWCVGHLVTMSYPEVYDPSLKKWSLTSLPFLPDEFRYEVLPNVKKQFKIVKEILNRPDVDTIYVCTDAGREGEYIYRLVELKAKVKGKTRKRVWIDSQTEDEIRRGIKEAKDLSAYDNLSASAFLRAKEDYLMGINFSRVLSLRYSNIAAKETGQHYSVISVGRVMTCVLGIVVKREREIRDFVETPFYRVIGTFSNGVTEYDEINSKTEFEGEWRVVEKSRYFNSPKLYKENGFLNQNDAKELVRFLHNKEAIVSKVEKKKETKNPPLLYNLAELQNDCSKRFKINPDETLRIAQELYEKKMITYPRTDARVVSSAVAKEIHKNLNGLMSYVEMKPYLEEIVSFGSHKNISKTRYVNDKLVTDHYAIIPTGEACNKIASLSDLSKKVYDLITKRFLSIFYPAAIYQRLSIIVDVENESFFTTLKVLQSPGYLKVITPNSGDFISNISSEKQKSSTSNPKQNDLEHENTSHNDSSNVALYESLSKLRKGTKLQVSNYTIKEGKTSPPKRYNSGSIILTMENAGQFIENDELREQIKGSGIGTSATRAEILKKLVTIKYLNLNKKTQIISPTFFGEIVYDIVLLSIPALLNPDLTASWEKGLTLVANGEITEEEYLEKLEFFVRTKTNQAKNLHNEKQLLHLFHYSKQFYSKKELEYVSNRYKKR